MSSPGFAVAAAVKVSSTTDRRAWWGGIPLLVAAAIQGLPLSFTVFQRDAPSALRTFEDNFQAVTTTGVSGSPIPLLVWGALYVLAGAYIARRGMARIRRHALYILLALLVLVGASALWSRYPLKVCFVAAHAAGAMLIATAAALRYGRDAPGLASALGFALGGAVLAHLGAVLAFPAIGVAWDGRWAGLSAQPNTLGLICVVSIWANVAGALMRRGGARAAHAALTAMAALCLAGTNSVTSSIAAVCCVAVLVFEHGASRISTSIAPYVRAAVAVVLLGGVAAATPVLLDAGWEGVAQRLGRSSDATGRTSLWETAASLISERPVLGWSFDDHATVMDVTGFPYTHFHNGVLDVAVRGGVVGAFLVLLVCGLLLRKAFARGPPQESALWRSFAVALVIHNLAEASLLVNRNAMWLVALVGFLVGRMHPPAAPAVGVLRATDVRTSRA